MPSPINDFRRSKLFKAAIIVPTLIALIFSIFNLTAPNDPEKISFDELLEVFWNIHDPTTINRQGPDIGTQYRSAIFFHNEDQKKKAELSKSSKQSEGTYPDGIVTEITPHETFYRAEEYHQRYFEKMGRH